MVYLLLPDFKTVHTSPGDLPSPNAVLDISNQYRDRFSPVGSTLGLGFIMMKVTILCCVIFVGKLPIPLVKEHFLR